MNENYKLLNKHRKKLSIFFALFVLFSIWTVVLFFNLSNFLSTTKKDNDYLKNKIEQIKNIIESKKF